MNPRAVAFALTSAALFGLSTPLAKALLGSIDAFVLAGLLYLGAGIGIAALRWVAPHLISETTAPEAPLGRSEVAWLAGAIAVGGVLGPLFLMVGLARTPAATTSLLLTFESVATALMAWFVFHENFDRRIALGMASLVAGAVILGWSGQPSLVSAVGPLAVIAACVCWGLDNNLTRKVSLADPLQIVMLKGLIAGPVSITLGLLTGDALPTALAMTSAMAVGFVGYGLSLVYFVLALRHLGTARTAAYFSTAPFLGAVAAVVGLGEPVSLQLCVAGALMGLGVWLHVNEHHEHEHEHESTQHTHAHVHDDMHRHAHASGNPPDEPHTHSHRHRRLRHRHPHHPDMHHTHRH